ncbi:hypothetical protein [Cellvibrio fibrivorans]|jgi:hypothetical protein|uniref:Solute-binding protein family 3/N-terminal domain-containing protein n=1 Tax=Cellvibrio fibrivorans TaxID=126350 RepID=A0ABU1UST4_9GAMM|nr:hypothetical protein [Cellvibrio fibrivorans]MDR7088242.1 hypothetical protein [Cellvibrio fibrivorans]
MNIVLRRLTFLIMLAAILLAASSSYAQAQSTASIAVLPDIHEDYRLFLGERRAEDVTYYGGNHARRDVIELILMQQALKLGGFSQPLGFVDEENYFRSIRNVIDGKTLTISGTIWYEDLAEQKDRLHISPPIVMNGQFIVGIYTSPQNQLALASKNLEQLTQLKVVTSSQWKPDLHTLRNLGFDKIMYTPNWVNMARMVNAGRVDIALSPFEMNKDKEIIVEGIRLIPIDGVKIAIQGSRHWPVSKSHPLGDEFYTALVKGVTQMRRNGTIERAYRECGFFHPDLTEWKLLNPPSN